jgi:RND family efflux transporter MFP subunit
VQAAAQVLVVRATNLCFSSSIPVTGFLVARREAVVTLGPGDKVSEVLAAEGDKVGVDQSLVQVARTTPARPGAEAKTETVALKSPVAGTVIKTTAVVGRVPSPMDREPLYRIAVDSEIELEAEVPSIRVPEVSAGQSARVTISDNRELPGRVRLAPPNIDEHTQLGRARISLSRDAQLQFSTFARAVISAERSCGLSVPRSAVTYRTGGTTLQVVYNGVIETRSVQVGLHSDNEVEVRKGLSEGDQVVANAGTTLRDGDKVKPVDSATLRTGSR